MAGAGDGKAGGIDVSEDIEVDEAVVQRRDQGVGHRMNQPHQEVILAGGVDHDGVAGLRQTFDRLSQGLAACGALVGIRAVEIAVETGMRGDADVAADQLGPAAPVLDIAGEALLPGVEVDGADGLARFQQRDGDMDREGGLPRSAFFIADDDNTRNCLT